MDVPSQRSGNSTPLSQLNSMVDSWTTKCNDNHDSTSIFDENIGEDGLSIQSAYDVNIDNPYHTGSLAPNLVKNPPPAPGSLFLGVAIHSASGRDLTRVPKPNSISGKPTSRLATRHFLK